MAEEKYQIIEVGGELVEFPATMSDDEIALAIKGEAPQDESSMFDGLGRQAGLLGRSLAKAVISGGGVGPFLTDPFQAMAGQQTATEGINNILDRVGFPKPESTLEKASELGSDTVLSIGGQAKAATGLLKAGVKSLAGKQVLTTLGDDVGVQVAAGVPAAFVADQIGTIAEDNNANPYLTGIAALAGGLLTGVVTGKAYTKATAAKIPLLTPEMVKAQASTLYQKVGDAGITVKPTFVKGMLLKIEKDLVNSEGGFLPDSLPQHAEVKSILTSYSKAADLGDVSFTSLDKLRSNTAKLASESTDPKTRRLLKEVVNGIDEQIGNLLPKDLAAGKGALKAAMGDIRDARGAWRRAAKATLLEDALDSGVRKGASPTGKEGEFIRSKFEALYTNKKLMKMFSAEEQEAIKVVAAGGKGLERILNYSARLNPARSMLAQMAVLGTTAVNPIVGLGGAALGVGSEVALGVLQKRAAKNLISQVASGKMKRPRSSKAWRAAVEAETQALQVLEEREASESGAFTIN